MKRRFLVAAALVVAGAAALAWGWDAPRAQRSHTTQRRIARLERQSGEILVSSDRAHVAYVLRVRGPHWYETKGSIGSATWAGPDLGRYMVQDGQPHAVYHRVLNPALTPDGEHLVYWACRNGQDAVVIDGRELGWHDSMYGWEIDPTTGQVLSMAEVDGHLKLKIDGEPYEYPYDISAAEWCPDGRGLALVVTVDGDQFLAIDDHMEGPYDEIGFWVLAFSPEGGRCAYEARRGETWRMVVDGQAGPPFDSVGLPQWSSRGDRLVYTAERDGVCYTVVDGKPEPRRRGFRPVLSPDGEKIAFVGPGPGPPGGMNPGEPTRVPDQWVLVDGREEGPYESVGIPVFSPDGQHLAYSARFRPRWKGPGVLVVDGEERPAEATCITFSPDSAHLAYVNSGAAGDELVLDGKVRGCAEFIGSVLFSPDSRHLAYVAHAKLSWDREAAMFFRFRQEERGHAAIQLTGPGEERVVLDGRPGPRFRGVCLQPTSFRDDGTLEYVGVRGKGVYAVVQEVEDGDWVSQ